MRFIHSVFITLLSLLLLQCAGIGGGGCTTDCPGVIGTDGEFYCNACNAHREGVGVEIVIKEYYYAQTKCNDPWGVIDEDEIEENLDLVEEYLKSMQADTYLDTNYVFNENLRQDCESCDCNTGYIFAVYSDEQSKQKLLELNFTTEWPN